MSKALWCDFGNHAFSELQRGTRTITMSGTDKYDNAASVSWTACNEHTPGIPQALTAGESDSPESKPYSRTEEWSREGYSSEPPF